MVLYGIIHKIKHKSIYLAVVINGFICHWFYKTNYWKYDLFFNCLFVMFINLYSTWHPQSLIITICSIIAWFLKSNQSLIYDAFIHIVFIQWFFSIGLYNYQLNNTIIANNNFIGNINFIGK